MTSANVKRVPSCRRLLRTALEGLYLGKAAPKGGWQSCLVRPECEGHAANEVEV